MSGERTITTQTQPEAQALPHGRADADASVQHPRRDRWAVFLVVAVVTIGGGVARSFIYDAWTYWSSAMALTGGSSMQQGHYELRGILTGIAFVPAALVTQVLGDEVARFAVLVQNSVVIAWFAAFLVPVLLEPWRRIGTRARWVAGGLVWAVLHGFAPYPLGDLYAVLAVLTAAVLLRRPRPLALALAGVLLGYALNVRPAYVPVAALIAVVVVVAHRHRAVWAFLGAFVALLPQAVYNLVQHGTPALTPVSTEKLVALQAGYAAYTVRYDTAPWESADPRQFFCSPSMAVHANPLPETTGELAGTYLSHFSSALPFALEKVAASLHWPMSAPYLNGSPGADALFAAMITLMSVAGCALLLGLPVLRRAGTARGTWVAWGLVGAVVVATVATLAGSATESRFAMPLVLLGLVGVVAMVDAGPGRLRAHPRLLGLVGVVAVAVLLLGYAGLAHPAPRGLVSPEICAEA